jgi:hypothetical protein
MAVSEAKTERQDRPNKGGKVRNKKKEARREPKQNEEKNDWAIQDMYLALSISCCCCNPSIQDLKA